MKAANAGGKILGMVLAVLCFLAISTPARADVTVNPKVIAFGTQAVGTRSASVSVTISNTGSRSARFNGAWDSSTQFSYWGPTGAFTVQAHQSLKVSVSFRPTAAQAFSGTLTFNRSNGSKIIVSLSGIGAGATTTPPPTVQAPSITSQPASRTVTAGQAASFSITAGGTATLNYQWMKNGAMISGATSANYTTPVTTTSDNGAQFTCTVSNSAGSMTSNAASLTVNTAAVAPSITSQPASRTVTAGQTASFTVGVSGTAPFTYQWKKNGAAISGATSSSYTTPAATSSDNGAQFAVAVSNATGSITSGAATLTVNAGTLLLSSSTGSLSFGNVNIGETATQSVTLTNTGNANVNLSGLSTSGAGFTAAGVSSGQILTPGQTATVTVNFKPAAAGNVTGSILVNSNAAAVNVSLSGAGVQAVSHSVQLSWTRSTSTVNGYFVYSSTAAAGPYTKLTTSVTNLPSYTDASVQNGKTYYYVVTAVDPAGLESSYSNQASAIVQ